MATGAGGVPDGIIFKRRDDRKNEKALLDLDITGSDRLRYIRAIKPTDACQLLDSTEVDEQTPERRLWVFGILVKKIPVYVKIQFGAFGNAVLCISFHRAEDTLPFLFR